MLAVLGVDVLDVVDPIEVLHSFVLIGWAEADVIFREAVKEGNELLLDRGQVILLQNNEVLPAVLLADGKGWTTGKQTIQEQADR